MAMQEHICPEKGLPPIKSGAICQEMADASFSVVPSIAGGFLCVLPIL